MVMMAVVVVSSTKNGQSQSRAGTGQTDSSGRAPSFGVFRPRRGKHLPLPDHIVKVRYSARASRCRAVIHPSSLNAASTPVRLPQPAAAAAAETPGPVRRTRRQHPVVPAPVRRRRRHHRERRASLGAAGG